MEEANELILKVADYLNAQQAILTDLRNDLIEYQNFISEEIKRLKNER